MVSDGEGFEPPKPETGRDAFRKRLTHQCWTIHYLNHLQKSA